MSKTGVPQKCKRAILLAAGRGKRLKPMTDYVPKCLMPILGRPLIDIWLEQLVAAGIEEIFINTSYKSDIVEYYLKNHPRKDRIRVIHENQLLGTAGTIAEISKTIEPETTLVIHADNLSIFSVKDFLNAHANRPESCLITMMTFTTSTPETCGIVSLDSKNVVTEFFEKVSSPPSNLANGAVFVVEPQVLEAVRTQWENSLRSKVIDLNGEYDFCKQVIPQYVNKIFTWYNATYHSDIGNPLSYANSLKDIEKDFPEIPAFDHSTWDKTIHQFELEEVLRRSFREMSLNRGSAS